MPNGHEKKDYGRHDYPDHDGTSDCLFECGCWMGQANSGGPVGLDPGGFCPNNPKDGERRGGSADYRDVVEQRISGLGQRSYVAEQELKLVAPDKFKIAHELAGAKNTIIQLGSKLEVVRRALDTDL